MTTVQAIRLEKLDSRIRAAWYRSQMLHVFAGMLAFFSCAIPLFLLGMFIDWMTYMPATGRVAILVVILGVAF